MTSESFRNLNPEQAEQHSPLLRALWQEAHGNWRRAHEIAQDIESPEAAWVHAYLHRREGDEAMRVTAIAGRSGLLASLLWTKSGTPLPVLCLQTDSRDIFRKNHFDVIRRKSVSMD